MSGFREKINGFCTFVWNSDEKTFLGRGGRSWAEIGAFYLIYYSCLAGFFCGMLAVFYQTIDESQPKLMGDDSLLKGNPGMGFQPMPDVEYTLIRATRDKKQYQPHVDSIKKILKPYLDASADADSGIDCAKEGNMATEEKACMVSYSKLTASCNETNDFGYGLNPPQPCVLLRLNKIFDWMPQEYNEDNIGNAGVSAELQQTILDDRAMIYIDCVGENPADVDNLGAKISYYPTRGYPHYYYPYRNQKGYLAPLVFVQFSSVEDNTGLMVECRALAPNIHYDRQEKEGGVHFELLIDP